MFGWCFGELFLIDVLVYGCCFIESVFWLMFFCFGVGWVFFKVSVLMFSWCFSELFLGSVLDFR